MRLIFVRHGEAMDDIEDRYGGWYDPDLSTDGLTQARQLGDQLQKANLNVEIILSSPLKRAAQAARILSEVLEISMRTCVYLKERNTYGLLSGENKAEAKTHYPELVAQFNAGDLVTGAESYEGLLARIEDLLKYVTGLNYKTLICVTHGKLLTALLSEFLHKSVKKLDQNCVVIVELTPGSGSKYIESTGVEFVERNP
jgi:broad specificity phosphatase PhoE